MTPNRHPSISQTDRDALDDLGLLDAGDCMGCGPHALEVWQAVAS